MSDLASNTRRSAPLPRFLAYDNGYGWVVVDRLVPGTGQDGVEAAYEKGKRGRVVGVFGARDAALGEARVHNERHPA
ncbi:MAG: hypothetical protein ISQ08_00145 [Planctomycetes bacterium]|nr:hypothetical protein [Planctomycetota bacterium]